MMELERSAKALIPKAASSNRCLFFDAHISPLLKINKYMTKSITGKQLHRF